MLTRAGFPSIQTALMRTQLRWAGHVARMPDHRIPKKLLFGELQDGRRSLGAPKKRFKDTLKTSLKAFGINPASWEQAAADRSGWRAAVHDGARRHESNRKAAAEDRRQERKNATKPRAPATIPCPHCRRTFQAQIGLISHLRTHRKLQPPPPIKEDQLDGHRTSHRRTNNIILQRNLMKKKINSAFFFFEKKHTSWVLHPVFFFFLSWENSAS